MENIDKIVDFGEWCCKCKHFDLPECMDPCHDCLNNPTNTNSRKPVRWEDIPEKDKKKKEKK